LCGVRSSIERFRDRIDHISCRLDLPKGATAMMFAFEDNFAGRR